MHWNLLGILLAVCAIACCVGFYKFVYFLSIGYGFAVAAGGVATLIMYLINPSATPLWIVLVQAALFVAYGARLSGFLLVRELKNVTFKKTDVAKETGTMIIMDDNFKSIVENDCYIKIFCNFSIGFTILCQPKLNIPIVSSN